MDSRKAKKRALVGIVVSMLAVGFDLTSTKVALPTMEADLGASTGEMQWIVDSYAIAFAACMLPAGLLGDRFGRRKLLVTGLVIFMIGSCVGVSADSSGLVIAARAVMGFGGALIMPLALAVLSSLFEGAERTKAIGVVTAGASIGMPLGPLLGGWLLDNFWWGSIFVLNIPLVAVGIAVCMLIPDTRDPSAPRVDVLSAALGILGVGALVFGVIETPTRGWGDALIVATLAGSVVLLGGPMLRERRAERPMLDLRLLSNPAFGWNTLVAVLATFVVTGPAVRGAAVPADGEGQRSALPPERAGSGTGVLTTLRQVGGAIGVAVLGSLLSMKFTDQLDTNGLPAG